MVDRLSFTKRSFFIYSSNSLELRTTESAFFNAYVSIDLNKLKKSLFKLQNKKLSKLYDTIIVK